MPPGAPPIGRRRPVLKWLALSASMSAREEGYAALQNYVNTIYHIAIYHGPVTRTLPTMPNARPTTKPIAGTFFYILLALTDRPRYGLGIAEEVARRTGGGGGDEIRMGPGTLYHAIKKMLEEGLIEECDAPAGGEESDPRRRYYRITRPGRDSLAAEAARLDQLVRAARDKHVLPAS